jgi:hypothetical protein
MKWTGTSPETTLGGPSPSGSTLKHSILPRRLPPMGPGPLVRGRLRAELPKSRLSSSLKPSGSGGRGRLLPPAVHGPFPLPSARRGPSPALRRPLLPGRGMPPVPAALSLRRSFPRWFRRKRPR